MVCSYSLKWISFHQKGRSWRRGDVISGGSAIEEAVRPRALLRPVDADLICTGPRGGGMPLADVHILDYLTEEGQMKYLISPPHCRRRLLQLRLACRQQRDRLAPTIRAFTPPLLMVVVCVLQCSCTLLLSGAFFRNPVDQQYFTALGVIAGMDYREANSILKEHGYLCFGASPIVGPDAEDGRWWQRAQSLDYEYQACPGPTWQEQVIISCNQVLQIRFNKVNKKILDVTLDPEKRCLGTP